MKSFLTMLVVVAACMLGGYLSNVISDHLDREFAREDVECIVHIADGIKGWNNSSVEYSVVNPHEFTISIDQSNDSIPIVVRLRSGHREEIWLKVIDGSSEWLIEITDSSKFTIIEEQEEKDASSPDCTENNCMIDEWHEHNHDGSISVHPIYKPVDQEYKSGYIGADYDSLCAAFDTTRHYDWVNARREWNSEYWDICPYPLCPICWRNIIAGEK